MKNTLKIFSLFCALLAGSTFALAQNVTTLTGTVTDSDTNNWIGATVTANLFNPGGGQPMSCNVPGLAIPRQVVFTLDATGSVPAATTLQKNSCIVPAGTSWTFTIQSLTSAIAVTIPTKQLTTNTFAFGAYASANITAPRFSGIKNAYGYGTVEFVAPVLGSTLLLTDVTPNLCDIFTTTGWAGCGTASGSGTVNAGVAPHLAYYAANGNTVSDSLVLIPIFGSVDPNVGGVTCDLSHVTQIYQQSGTLPNTASTTWVCTSLTGPSFHWVSENSLLWGFVQQSNTPSNNQTCVASSSTSCTWTSPAAPVARQWSCQPGFGDGANATTAGTYLSSTCKNTTGSTLTLTGFQCFTDNNGTSTVNVTNSTNTALLTGAITCSNTFATGTQSATVTLANGDYLKWTYVADGVSTQSTWVANATY